MQDGDTALHRAVSGGHTEVAVWLAGVGASVTEKNNVSDVKLFCHKSLFVGLC